MATRARMRWRGLRGCGSLVWTATVLLCLGGPCASVVGAGRRSVSVVYRFQDVRVTHVGGSARVAVTECAQHEPPGKPSLPFRTARILVPPGWRVDEVRAEALDPARAMDLDAHVEFGRSPRPLARDGGPGADAGPRDRPDPAIYGSEGPYPAARAVLASVQKLCGHRIALVRVFPVQYLPRNKRLLFTPRLRVSLGLAEDAARVEARLMPGARRVAAARAAAVVDNPELLAEYEAPLASSSTAPAPGDAPMAAGGEAYDYLLITSDALLNHASAPFQPLIDQKIADGLAVKAETVESIYATSSGADDQEKIRNFITHAYTTWGVQYVLLAGDASVVPYRCGYARYWGTTSWVEENIPTDLYYACLDGTWNGDGDTTWGEQADGDGGGDVDLLAEVYVGRAPVDTPAEAATFVGKVVAYEQNAHPNRDQALFLGEFLGPPGYTGIGYQGGDALEKLEPDFANYTIDWLDDRPNHYATWSGADCLTALNQSPHIVAHVGHGSELEVLRLQRSDTDSLTNSGLFLVNSMACDAGMFDYSDCIGEDFSKRSAHGAFAVIMNTRDGWYMETAPWKWSGEFQQAFFKRLLTQGIVSVGAALQLSKHDMVGSVETSGQLIYRWCYFSINLLGDPHTALQAASATRTLTVRSFDATPSVQSSFGGLPVAVTPAPDGTTPFLRAYSAGSGVTLTAPATAGDLSFLHWELDGVDQAAGAAALAVTMDTDHTAVAVYGAPALSVTIDMTVFQPGTSQLNPTGPAPRTLGILSVDVPGGTETTEVAITIGGGHWLQFVGDDVDANGAAAEWHTAAEWAGKRLRGLTPGTAYAFQAQSRDGPGGEESELVDAGAYSTNGERDADRSGAVTADDLAHVRAAVLSGSPLGQPGCAWATDVDDSRQTTVLDVLRVKRRVLGLD